MEATKERMELLDKNSNAYKDEQDRFEELKNAWMKSLQDFNSQVEKSIQDLFEEYKNNISVIFDDLGNKLTGGKGLKSVQDDWELINKEADMYLDKINSLA
jgi:inorganic pyrophosphatase